MNGQINMHKRLAEALMDAVKLSDKCGFDGRDCDWAPKAWFVAQQLLKNGVLVPPVKEGQTVYAVLFEGDEADIYPWQVQGVAHMQGKWYAVEHDGSEWEVGGACCFLTEQAAEEYKKQETKRRTVGDLRPQSVSTCSQSEDGGPYEEVESDA